MFNGKIVDKLVKETVDEIDTDGCSATYDNVMFDFIDYLVKVLQEGSGLFLQDAIDHLKSDDMIEDFKYHVEEYAKIHIKPKYSPDDLVVIPKEQLEELLKAAGR